MQLSRATKIALATLAIFVLMAVTGAFAYDASKKDEIAPGVRIAGIEVGGQDTEEARGLLKESVVRPLMRPVHVEFEGESYELTPKELDMDADVQGMLDEAVDASRNGGLPTRLVRYATDGEVSTDLAPKISYSGEKLDDAVDKIVDEIDRDPVDASITPTADSITPTEGEDGIEVDSQRLHDDVEAALQQGSGTREVRPDVSHTAPEVTTDELAAKYPTYVTIDREHYKLTLWKNLKVKKEYGIAVGQAGLETPEGLYTVNDKQINPTWHVPDSDWAGSLAGQDIPPGPGNPLVARWIGIYDGAGIHGTDEPDSIGSAVSHGCVRMQVPDVIDLYDRVPMGTPLYVG